MIGSLRGTLAERGPGPEVLVEVGGVGYRCTVAPTTLAALGEPGTEVFLHVHHHIREDSQVLYGFAHRVERMCFEALIGAHGVGPALALAILSVHTPGALHQILADDDVDALTLVPGVGKKTAQRLLVELKSRLDVPDLDLTVPAAGDGDRQPAHGAGTARSDVRAALTQLGYGDDEVRDALRDLPAEGDTEVLLKAALQRLAVSR